jgi:16S rRNA (cytidine1402-2'-O)-methyltransferase
MSGRLYVVATPIGNLGDMTDRARETLAGVDLVAAEDTRHTGRLLAHFGIKARLLSLFEGNEDRRSEAVVRALHEGKDVALVSDAGMPAISDPGYPLVRACVAEGIDVRVVPGPSAVTAALVLSGMPTDRFVFEGFLPRKASERRARLGALVRDPRTAVLFESPHRVATLLRDVLVELGDRPAALVREVTKRHEQVDRGRVSELLAGLGGHEPRGEVVLVLGGDREPETLDVDRLAEEAAALVEAGARKREAAAEIARRHGASTNDVYRAMV